MKVLAIIAEYNPFHNGHLHHISMAKQITGADYVVVVMSGNFVQRGIPSIINKYSRTRICLENNIDLIIELPVSYSCASAEYFASSAVALLDKTGIIDYLVFGSECDNLSCLKKIAEVLTDEPKSYNDKLKEFLKEGHSFPLARSKSLISHLINDGLIGSDEINNYENILSSSNNILAIEYLKALGRRNSKIKPISIKRLGSDYNSENLGNQFSSATAIRKTILSGSKPALLKSNMPYVSYSHIAESINYTCPIEENDFSTILASKLVSLTRDDLYQYFDISRELANRIENNKNDFINFNQFATLIKTKEITLSRINRALLHIVLEIKKEDIEKYVSNDYVFYIRILGFKKASSILLSRLKESTKLPIIVKLSNSDLCEQGWQMLNNNLYADNLYRIVTMNKFKTVVPNEFTQRLIISS